MGNWGTTSRGRSDQEPKKRKQLLTALFLQNNTRKLQKINEVTQQQRLFLASFAVAFLSSLFLR
jgi:hypothetical protein